MHPLEQLRYLARGWESVEDVPVGELAEVLAGLAELSPATLLHACRRLIEYFPSSGRLWWLAARALSAPEPVEAIWEAAAELESDPTARQLAKALPPGASVSLLGPAPAELARALRAHRDGSPKKKGSRERIFVVSVLAAGPDGLLVDAGVAGELAGLAGERVWGVVPRGTVLPGPLWEQVLARATRSRPLSPAALSLLVGPSGAVGTAGLLSFPECPPVAELLGWRS